MRCSTSMKVSWLAGTSMRDDQNQHTAAINAAMPPRMLNKAAQRCERFPPTAGHGACGGMMTTTVISRFRVVAPAAWRYSPRCAAPRRALVSIASGVSGVCKGLPETVRATGSGCKSLRCHQSHSDSRPRKCGIGSLCTRLFRGL
jgi:hypothetical protein